MKQLFVIVTSVFIIQGCDQIEHMDDDFYGIVESRPVETAGTWVVGGRTVKATENTKLDEEHGSSFAVGACVKVEMEDDLVEEIESESPGKCEKTF